MHSGCCRQKGSPTHYSRGCTSRAPINRFGKAYRCRGESPVPRVTLDTTRGGHTMFQAYHGVTAAEHQAKFNLLSGQGYRMISLSVYADPGDARYAAVWVQRSGPAWAAVHGLDGAGYQS